jgi:prepilin-type N-terminal cleavage/methylation domain-containing protein
MANFKEKFKSGFTLVEIIVVLFVISLGLVGVLTLIIQSIQSQSYNKNNLVAYQLAQEGIELVRKTRDSNWKETLEFNASLVPGEYYMDYLDAVPNDASADPDNLTILRQDANGFYFHGPSGSGDHSGFSRRLIIEDLDADSFRVIARISWYDHDRFYEYDLETVLYDWK